MWGNEYKRQLTLYASWELLDGHRWNWNTFRPVSNLRLVEVGHWSGPFTLELLLTNSLLSSRLLFLLNLEVEQNQSQLAHF